MRPLDARLLASSTLALAVGLAASGCARSCGDDETGNASHVATSASEHTVSPLSRYFPLGRGDRWRTRGGSDGTVPRVYGVTGVDARGVAVVFGGAGTTPERYTASATEIARVDEQGRTLVPLLRAPLDEGAAWSYTLAERGVSIPCEARVVRVDAAPRSLRGVPLAGCATVRRVCRYPVGTPFPLATTHTQDATYCPDVGLVEETQRFSPPPAPGLLPSQTIERLVTWNVAGGPLPAPRPQLDCDDALLMPSDVQSACGAGLVPVGERTGELEGGACVFRFAGSGRSVEIRVRRSTGQTPPRHRPSSSGPRAPRSPWTAATMPACLLCFDRSSRSAARPPWSILGGAAPMSSRPPSFDESPLPAPLPLGSRTNAQAGVVPPPPFATRVTAPLPSEDDLVFVAVLRGAGLVQELDDRELARAVAAQQLRSAHGIARNLDLLETYFGAAGDAATAKRRKATDRFFAHRDAEAVTAARLVERLSALAPEVGPVALERIGGGVEGQLVLRAGEQIAAVVDDEEVLDTNEIDLTSLDAAQTITIRGIVRAINVLLARVGVRARLVPLRSDGTREIYVGVGVAAAMELAGAGLLEDEDADELMDLGSW